MAENILSSLLSQASFSLTDLIQGNAVAPNLQIVKVGIKLKSIIQRHMQEDGTTVVDSRVLVPTVVNVDCFCPDIDTLDQVNQLLVDRDKLYKIATKGLIIDYLRLDKEDIRQTPEVLSASPLRLVFKQVLIQGNDEVVFAQSADASVLDRGLSLLNGVSSGVTGLISTVSSNINGFLGSA